MTEPRLHLSVVDSVARLRLSRPSAANAIDLDFAQEFESAALGLARQRVRAVLLTAEGANFCVGGDLKSFAGQRDLAEHLDQVTTHLHRGILTLVNLDAPVVVAVHGAVAGAGLGLVMAADVAIADETSTFLMAYTKVGLTPDGSTSWFLPRLVGLRRALDLSLTNRSLDAREALELGLLSRVVEGDAGDAAEAVALDLAGGPTAALGVTARLMRASYARDLADQLRAETTAIVERAATANATEGIAAFLERRVPDFGAE